MGHFKNKDCPECRETLQGLQLTAEQRVWLDQIKNATLQHLINTEAMEMTTQEHLDHQGWKAMAEAMLFLYGYMLSREEDKQ